MAFTHSVICASVGSLVRKASNCVTWGKALKGEPPRRGSLQDEASYYFLADVAHKIFLLGKIFNGREGENTCGEKHEDLIASIQAVCEDISKRTFILSLAHLRTKRE